MASICPTTSSPTSALQTAPMVPLHTHTFVFVAQVAISGHVFPCKAFYAAKKTQLHKSSPWILPQPPLQSPCFLSFVSELLSTSKPKLGAVTFQHSKQKPRINSFLCNLTLHISEVLTQNTLQYFYNTSAAWGRKLLLLFAHHNLFAVGNFLRFSSACIRYLLLSNTIHWRKNVSL